MKQSTCRFCGTPLEHTFVDLGATPLSNGYLSKEDLTKPEAVYPLHTKVCSECLLVQLDTVVPPEGIFEHYVYFSSYSTTWLEHAKTFVENITQKLNLNSDSLVYEIASNDGYLLKNFVAKQIPCLGIEPAKNVAEIAQAQGVPTYCDFFGTQLAHKLAQEKGLADLIIGNNVLAHVPDINDVVGGIKVLLKPHGNVCIEVPHLLNLIKENQFDTIYHEHYSYFSLVTLNKIFLAHGLKIYHVDELPTHGGSIRITATHQENNPQETDNYELVLNKELEANLEGISGYHSFAEKVEMVCRELQDFLATAKQDNKKFVAYGAAAKGNTLLNVCEVSTDLVEYVVDQNPHKQGLYLPGSHLPIYSPQAILPTKPDYILILPWNLKSEIISYLKKMIDWQVKYVTAIPHLEVVE